MANFNLYLLNVSKAANGADGMWHVGVALCVGQNPVVNTRMNKSTPPKFI